MNEDIKVFNYNSKKQKINPKDLVITDKFIYEIIKKYIKGEK